MRRRTEHRPEADGGRRRGAGKAAWRILRPGNCAMAALGALVGIALATFGTWATALATALAAGARTHIWIGAPLAAFLITAAGNIANDIVDRPIDRIAHPGRPLVTGILSLRTAGTMAAVLLLAGLAAAWWAGGMALWTFAAANAGLLAFYEGYAKARPLVGNIVVAWLVGSTFLFGGYAWGGVYGAAAALPLAVMAALSTLAREALKDIEDAEGDRQVRRTLPMVLGARGTWLLAAVAITAAVLYAFYDALAREALPWPYLVPVAAVFAAGVAVAWVRPGQGQRWVKLAMLLALAAYLVPGVTAVLGRPL